ncbi:hypothetical protein KI387_019167, partial [Taxus chinensis]
QSQVGEMEVQERVLTNERTSQRKLWVTKQSVSDTDVVETYPISSSAASPPIPSFRRMAPMNSEKKSSVSDMGAWAMNIISSVGIIMVNKEVMSQAGYDFRFATTLTSFHFLVTAIVGFISNASGYSTSKHVPLWDLIWFSVVANMSIVGMNLSLMLNSVGFYQISKLSMVPVVCVMEWILHNKTLYQSQVKAAVFVVVIGVGVCTVTDVK